MSKRFWFLTAALILIVVLAWPNLTSEESTALDLFLWLFLILLVSGVALWPGTGRDQQAELGLERRTWADRIEFADGEEGAARARETVRPAKPV